MKRLRQIIVIAIVLLLGFFIQINLSQFIPSLRCVPNIMLILVFSFGFLRGTKTGMAVGIAAGLLMDFVQGNIVGFYVLIFVYIGFINGVLKRYFTSNVILLPIILCTVNEILYHGAMYLFQFREQAMHTATEYLRHVVIPEYLVTLIAAIVVYGVILLIHRKLEKIEKKGETQFV